MTLDHLRNSYYSDAIKKVIDKDSVVLDLGAGLGLHGFMAAYNGEKKGELYQLATFIRNCTYYPKPPCIAFCEPRLFPPDDFAD